jgi:hypothetical protein
VHAEKVATNGGIGESAREGLREITPRYIGRFGEVPRRALFHRQSLSDNTSHTVRACLITISMERLGTFGVICYLKSLDYLVISQAVFGSEGNRKNP